MSHEQKTRSLICLRDPLFLRSNLLNLCYLPTVPMTVNVLINGPAIRGSLTIAV